MMRLSDSKGWIKGVSDSHEYFFFIISFRPCFFFFFVALEMEPMALNVLGKHSTAELCSWPFICLYFE